MDGIVPTPFHIYVCKYSYSRYLEPRRFLLLLKIFQVVLLHLLLLIRVDDNLYQCVCCIYDYAPATSDVPQTDPQNITTLHTSLVYRIFNFRFILHICVYTEK